MVINDELKAWHGATHYQLPTLHFKGRYKYLKLEARYGI